jgi:hypothetical protein
MSENQAVPAEVPTPPDPAQPPETPTPTRTHYQQVADNLLAAIAAFVAEIPSFETAETMPRSFIRRKRGVPREFVNTAVGALITSPELQSVKQLDATVSADNHQYVEGLSPVLNQLGTIYKDLKATLDGKRALLASDAQQIYAVARSLAHEKQGGALLSHVENMRRALRPRRKKAKKGAAVIADAASSDSASTPAATETTATNEK